MNLVIILGAVGLYGLIHSWLASHSVKTWIEKRSGTLGKRWYRLFYNLFALVSFIPVFAVASRLPDQVLYMIPLPWLLVTLSFQVLSIVVLFFGVVQTDVWTFIGLRQLTNTSRGKPGEMVVSGLYQWVRHPIYTAGLVFIWCAPVMTGNLLALNIGLTLYILIGAWFEERKLVVEFGEAYLSYQKTTPMLVPFLRIPGKGN